MIFVNGKIIALKLEHSAGRMTLQKQFHKDIPGMEVVRVQNDLLHNLKFYTYTLHFYEFLDSFIFLSYN